MVSTKVIAAMAVYSAVAAAAPTAPQTKTFSLVQEAVPKSSYRAPAAKLAKALAKFGAPIPDHVAAAAAATGSVSTTPTEYDSEYVTKVTVGASTLNLDIDTGSADLWAFSSKTPSSERSGHNYYKPSSSATEVSGDSWDISYGDGSSAKGVVYKDKVTIGGVSYAKQAVEAATSVSSEFTSDTSIDGLLGLAFSSINTVSPTPQKTFFDNVKSSLAKPIFVAILKHDEAGSYDFGFTDSSKYTGEIAYTDVDDSQGFWSFTADSYSIAGSKSGGSITGIADTGTTLLLLDDSIVDAYYKKVNGASYDSSQGGYVFSCSATLPTFAITVNGHTATIPGDYINYAPVDSSGSSCYGGIQSNSGIGFSIFGDVFLKSQYVVFDASGPQIGFATQA
ncbi:aspartic proteinase II-1 [Talaromyces proteolyticus]|uniref:Aspartic proteinase II-1 n=1 Tax=Talaromyces proteolyticus TaxID=1131652 RepID=A0AAD4PWL8_9EURO|nr:aspartic proteinase II-1 [Talaromyces proteolyticus]KAH8691659.1 aspartic proteinase II-1 [Talaromyces proteolyticus]